MIIYIDTDFKCHISNKEGYREINTSCFDDKCEEFIEGYRFIPQGESWTREDGITFQGEMIAPWKPYAILEALQIQYEKYLKAYQRGVQNA